MHINPITTNYNIQFQRLNIKKAAEWDVDILETVVNSPSIYEYTKYLAQRGKDLSLWACTKPINMIFACNSKGDDLIARGLKDEVFEQLANFDYRKMLAEKEVEKLKLKSSKEKRDAIMAKVEEFNNQNCVKKRNFLQRLFSNLYK